MYSLNSTKLNLLLIDQIRFRHHYNYLNTNNIIIIIGPCTNFVNKCCRTLIFWRNLIPFIIITSCITSIYIRCIYIFIIKTIFTNWSYPAIIFRNRSEYCWCSRMTIPPSIWCLNRSQMLLCWYIYVYDLYIT